MTNSFTMLHVLLTMWTTTHLASYPGSSTEATTHPLLNTFISCARNVIRVLEEGTLVRSKGQTYLTSSGISAVEILSAWIWSLGMRLEWWPIEVYWCCHYCFCFSMCITGGNLLSESVSSGYHHAFTSWCHNSERSEPNEAASGRCRALQWSGDSILYNQCTLEPGIQWIQQISEWSQFWSPIWIISEPHFPVKGTCDARSPNEDCLLINFRPR